MPHHSTVLADSPRPGSPSRRIDRADVCVAYTSVMLTVENDSHTRGLIAITVCDDPWFHLTRYMVQEAAGRWLGVPRRAVGVDFFPPKGFLLLLPSPDLRGRAMAGDQGFSVGQARLHLMPWYRMAGAEAAKLPFKIRLCIEGIPPHARQATTVRQLLPRESLLEFINNDHRSDSEAHCCCVVIWARDPDAIAKEAVLRLEELQDRQRAAWHFTARGHSPPTHRPGAYPELCHDHPRRPSHRLQGAICLRRRLAGEAQLLLAVGVPGRLAARTSPPVCPGPPKRERSPHQGDGEPSSRRGGLDRPHSGGAPPNGPRNNRHHGSGAQWVLKADLVGQRPLPHATPTKLFFVNKAIVQEPMPWELHQARQVSAACGGTGQNQKFWPPKDHPSSYQNSKPEPTNSFGMQDLRDALPDPMVLESTLPLPLAIIHRTAPTLQAVATLGGTVCYRAS
jgi:hypothetical protein